MAGQTVMRDNREFWVSEGDIPACGDHPHMIGYMVGPDDGKSTLHRTPQEAVDKYLEKLLNLVGRTFEKDGLRRTVHRIEEAYWRQGYTPCGDVYWSRPGQPERQKPMMLYAFQEWLEGAVEVH